jgi:hypothetical protein
MNHHKLARGVAHNVCSQFATSADHIAFIAAQASLERFDVDLLAARFEPDWLNEDRNVNLAMMCRDRLLYAMGKLPRFQLAKAMLHVVYYPANAAEGKPLSADYTVVLTDVQSVEVSYCLKKAQQNLSA